MEESIQKTITAIHNRMDNAELRGILLQFYKDRTIEILEHIEQAGAGTIIDFDKVKIGGTD